MAAPTVTPRPARPVPPRRRVRAGPRGSAAWNGECWRSKACLPARTSSCIRAAATRGTGPRTAPATPPGSSPGDVRELLERGATVLVLSLGMDERLRIAPPTLELLRQTGVEVHVRETRAAAALYDSLAADGRPVGGLFHSTC
ncbi:MTH938/NDUFAF3 family protein [Streptomyces cinnamoneus]